MILGLARAEMFNVLLCPESDLKNLTWDVVLDV